MSRDINVNDPGSWSDEDKAYLRDRVDTVPAQHREHLDLQPVGAPTELGESVEVARLREFLMANYPDEVGAEGDSPVGVAIRLLTDDTTVDPDAVSDDDDYDDWSVADLRKEADSRRNNGRSVPDVSKAKKDDVIAALRADDNA